MTKSEAIRIFNMKPTRPKVQQEDRDYLAKSARINRALRGTVVKKPLVWEPFSGSPTDGVIFAKVGRGRLILRRPIKPGVPYVSSFGPNSERSFSGFLPGLTLEEAKQLVHQDAQKHW